MFKLIRFSLPKVMNRSNVQKENIILPNSFKRHSSYESSKPIPRPENLPKYEVTKDENDWKYVERLLPDVYVPPVESKKIYPSGWVPQKYNPKLPYAIKRTKNGMLPIYLYISHRGLKRVTRVTHIHGDIWKLANDLKEYLERVEQKVVCVKMNEICGIVSVHGDHVSNAKVWALRNKL